jgi:hypothetical protein
MRYAGNFHQEWGYLAPAPSFIRTARVILVAAAVGATAGAGVVFSLVGREDTETSVAARTLARPAEAASAQLNVLPPAAPAALASGAQDHAPRSLAADAPRAGAADSESKPSSTTMAPAGIAALAEVPAVTEDASPHPATSPSAAVPSPVAAPARLGVSSPPASAPSAAAGVPAKAAVSPAAATGAPAVEGAPAQQKVVAAKKRIAPRFASRAGSSRIAPGEYYMSADNYENRGRGGYYRANGWNGGYSQSGGRFQSW